MTTQAPYFATTEEVAEILRIRLDTLYEYIAEGKAPPHLRAGKRILFPLGPIFDEWTREQTRSSDVA